MHYYWLTLYITVLREILSRRCLTYTIYSLGQTGYFAIIHSYFVIVWQTPFHFSRFKESYRPVCVFPIMHLYGVCFSNLLLYNRETLLFNFQAGFNSVIEWFLDAADAMNEADTVCFIIKISLRLIYVAEHSRRLKWFLCHILIESTGKWRIVCLCLVHDWFWGNVLTCANLTYTFPVSLCIMSISSLTSRPNAIRCLMTLRIQTFG